MIACFEGVNLICKKLDDFQAQRIEFQFKCMDFLLKNKVSCWKIDQETFCVFFFMSPKEIAKA